MNLTTVARVKQRIGIAETDFDQDAILGQLVARVSAECEVLMNRNAESKSRTVQQDCLSSTRSISLPGYPVSSITTVHNDHERVFGDSTLVSSTYYYAELESGILSFEITLIPGRGALKVVYVGGMAATTNDFIAAYPDISGAIDQRVAQLWQRRNDVGLTSVGGSQGNVSSLNVDWIPDSLSVIEGYRRLGRA